jgi:hypothetical protein
MLPTQYGKTWLIQNMAIFQILRLELSGTQHRVVSMEQTDVSEVRTASVIRVIMEAVRLHGTISQNALIFIPAAMRS